MGSLKIKQISVLACMKTPEINQRIGLVPTLVDYNI